MGITGCGISPGLIWRRRLVYHHLLGERHNNRNGVLREPHHTLTEPRCYQTAVVLVVAQYITPWYNYQLGQFWSGGGLVYWMNGERRNECDNSDSHGSLSKIYVQCDLIFGPPCECINNSTYWKSPCRHGATSEKLYLHHSRSAVIKRIDGTKFFKSFFKLYLYRKESTHTKDIHMSKLSCDHNIQIGFMARILKSFGLYLTDTYSGWY